MLQRQDCMQFIPLAVLKLRIVHLFEEIQINCMQFIPLAVLKRYQPILLLLVAQLHAIHTACGIETTVCPSFRNIDYYCMQFIPLAVLKLANS